MPYIAIKSYPKDEATKMAVARKINEVFLELWGCPQEAITIGIEEIAPADWNARVDIPEIQPKEDEMLLLRGKWKS